VKVGDAKSAADTATQLLHDPIDFIASRVTDRQSRINENVRAVAREQLVDLAIVGIIVWELSK